MTKVSVQLVGNFLTRSGSLLPLAGCSRIPHRAPAGRDSVPRADPLGWIEAPDLLLCWIPSLMSLNPSRSSALSSVSSSPLSPSHLGFVPAKGKWFKGITLVKPHVRGLVVLRGSLCRLRVQVRAPQPCCPCGADPGILHSSQASICPCCGGCLCW